MAKKEVVGIGQRRSGKSAKGTDYDFTPLYCLSTKAEVDGELAEEITFSHRSGMIFPDVHVGDIINVSYDKRGFLEEFEVVEKAGTGKGLKLNSGNS